MIQQNMQLRRYRPSDLDKIEQLFMTHYDASHVPARKIIFDWVACHNPLSDNETCYLVIEENDKIIAYQGRMPVELMINGQKERGYFFYDTLVHPEYRKEGLGGLPLVNSLLDVWENETDTFAVAIWMAEFTQKCLARRGYHRLDASYLIRPIDFNSVLMRVVKNRIMARIMAFLGHSFLSLGKVISNRRYPGISISQISRFDRSFDDFADRVSKKFPLIVLRNSQYLNWKFIDKPFANFTILTAAKDGKLTGYVILLCRKKEMTKEGMIVDILADPEDIPTIDSLCQAAVEYFKKEKAEIIRCFLTNKNYVKVFRKNFFFKRRRTIPIMIGNLHKHHACELIKDINNWFFTFGDSDEVVWR